MNHQLRVILCGQRAFGAAVFDMIREEFPEIEIAAVYAPVDDKLSGRASIRGVPLRRVAPAGDWSAGAEALSPPIPPIKASRPALPDSRRDTPKPTFGRRAQP